ncbi:glutathione S-transferase [Agrilus planipennis]|uniref:glutathione transferase n=1 Tax=Agrilus planipennis TaxID=224129 RepID=A0A1W4XUP6_AGRPL|nr:glutathione S-transferase [Agrilus planipennis]
MAPHYKLIYFNSRGRAETIRLIFAYAGVEYEDVRIPKERWNEYKKKTPFGRLPVLEIDGKPVAETLAIARYLAKVYGLNGKNDWEDLKCDELVGALDDLKQGVGQFRREEDPVKKEELKVKLMREIIPFYLAKFEKIVSENNGHCVGSNVTWCDLLFAASLESFENVFGKTALEQYPSLKALKESVYNIPSIAAWVARRPVTDS